MIKLLFSFVGMSNAISQDTTDVDLSGTNFFYLDDALLDSGGVFTFWGIYFQLGSYKLIDTVSSSYQHDFDLRFMQSNEARLSAIVGYMHKHPTYIIEIGVHRDCRGSEASSTRLTPKRAQTIVAELVKLGVAEDRLIAKGFGESQPYNDNGKLLTCKYITSLPKKEGEAMHQKNRRFQLKVLSKNYTP